jgi:hypothetical protein
LTVAHQAENPGGNLAYLTVVARKLLPDALDCSRVAGAAERGGGHEGQLEIVLLGHGRAEQLAVADLGNLVQALRRVNTTVRLLIRQNLPQFAKHPSVAGARDFAARPQRRW